MNTSLEQLLNAVNAFIQINIMELAGYEYIDRLAYAVKTCNLCESTFAVFTKLFDNKKICSDMLRWLDQMESLQ